MAIMIIGYCNIKNCNDKTKKVLWLRFGSEVHGVQKYALEKAPTGLEKSRAGRTTCFAMAGHVPLTTKSIL